MAAKAARSVTISVFSYTGAAVLVSGTIIGSCGAAVLATQKSTSNSKVLAGVAGIIALFEASKHVDTISRFGSYKGEEMGNLICNNIAITV
jgi:hypothetical protein